MFKHSNAYSNILFVRSVVSFVFPKWIRKVERQSNKQRKLSKMTQRNRQMMKSNTWLNCLKGNPVCGIFFSNEYKDRDYAELVKHFDSSSAIVKAKINALRAQLGRQMVRQQTKYYLIQHNGNTDTNESNMLVQHLENVEPTRWTHFPSPWYI